MRRVMFVEAENRRDFAAIHRKAAQRIAAGLLTLALSACATPPASSPQAHAKLTQPAVYCDHILISGDLATNVAGLNLPPHCDGFSKNGIASGAMLSTGGWVGEARPAPDNQFAGSLVLFVGFYDIPLTFGIMPHTDPDKDLKPNERHVTPPLEAELSSSTTRIEQVTLTTDRVGDKLVCVRAYKAVILDRMLDIHACRQIDTTASAEAIAALARAIVRNDLSQIDAKE